MTAKYRFDHDKINNSQLGQSLDHFSDSNNYFSEGNLEKLKDLNVHAVTVLLIDSLVSPLSCCYYSCGVSLITAQKEVTVMD